ncbi:MAG: Ig-like domain-containing protein [Tannerella sp.]|jgi:hypothetical protein|nr:Ig-like domain-containing protein [Tannerella sp.]
MNTNMKNRKKINSIIVGTCLLLLGSLAGCDNYERKGIVTPEITVNVHSLDLFIGESVQLTASPDDLAFTWTSEDPAVATVDNNGFVTAVGDGNTFIVAQSGDMDCRVPVSSITRIPLTDFSLGATSLLLFTGERNQFIPVNQPSNANDASYPTWRSLNSDVATVDYKGEIVARSVGNADVECRINNIVKTIHVEVLNSFPMFRGPHKLTATVPYTLQFINFDLGGEGVAYHDNDAGNSGGNAYRANNGDPNGGAVDIGGDLAVGWTAGGEWLKYTIVVYDAGDYSLSMDLAGANTSDLHFEVDGENVTGNIHIPSTGGWSNWAWQDIEVPFTFTEGTHTLRFYLDAAGTNFRNMRFTYKE